MLLLARLFIIAISDMESFFSFVLVKRILCLYVAYIGQNTTSTRIA